MSRPKCCCKVRGVPAHRLFRPHEYDGPEPPTLALAIEELEAVRLADLEGLYHEAAARLMEVSRPTFGRLLASGRRKLAQAVMFGLGLRIEGEFPPPPEGSERACPRGLAACCRVEPQGDACPHAACPGPVRVLAVRASRKTTSQS